MIFVGDSSKAALEKLRVRTIGDLARLDRELLEKKLGKQGAALSLYANGLDKSPVRSVYEEREVKSIGNSITFKRNLTGIGTSASACGRSPTRSPPGCGGTG